MKVRKDFENRLAGADAWMSVRNRHFSHQAPVDLIREQGFRGLLMIYECLMYELSQQGGLSFEMGSVT